jgi:hypothetical protein
MFAPKICSAIFEAFEFRRFKRLRRPLAQRIANKLTRIAWSALHHGLHHEPRINAELA